MRGVYADFFARFVAYLGRAGLVLVGLSWSVVHAQALPSSWALVPKAAETANGYRISYAPGASGTSLVTSGRTVAAAAANDALIATESATLRTAAGNVTLAVGRSVAGSAVRTALAEAAIGAARGGLVGAGIGAAAALAPLLEQWMKDQGYMKGSDGTFRMPTGGNTTPGASSDNAYCFKKIGCVPMTASSHLEQYIQSVWINGQYNGGYACTPDTGWSYCLVLTQGGRVVQTFQSNAWLIGNTGRCPDGSHNETLCVGTPEAGGEPSAADVAAKAAAAPMPATITDWEAALGNAAALGSPVDLPETATVAGPSSLVGPDVVTSTQTIVDVNGQTKTLNTTAHQVASLTYSGDEVAIQTATVTLTQNPDGSTTETRTGDTKQPDVCSLFPNVLGCTPLGAPEAASMPTASKTIAYTAESVSLPTGCPAPISMGRFGSLSFQPACDSAGYMKPLILAGSAISALMICVAAVAGVKP